MTDLAPDGMTELYDAAIDRVDLVGHAANGTRILLAKGAAGLVPADTVRDLIKTSTTPTEREAAMAEQQDTAAETVTPIEKETEDTAPATEATADAAAVDAPVVKADAPLLAVYDANGCLVGVVDPDAVTPVAGAGTTDPDGDGDSVTDTDGDGDGAIHPDGDGMSKDDTVEMDGADGGFADAAAPVNPTEADGSSTIDGADYGDDDEDARTIPGTNTIQSPVRKTDGEPGAAETSVADLLKEYLAPLAEQIAKAADLAGTVQVLQEQVAKFGAMPDNRTLPAFNGANGVDAGIAPREGSGDPLEPLRKAVQAAQDAGDPEALTKAQSALLFESVKNRFNH